VLHEVDVADSPLLMFHRADALAATLKGLDVRIVLSTSWVSVYGQESATGVLPAELRAMIVGATYQAANSDLCAWLPLSRYQQIMAYVQSRQIVNWIAIDDDVQG